MKEVKVNAFEELAMDEMMAVDGGGKYVEAGLAVAGALACGFSTGAGIAVAAVGGAYWMACHAPRTAPKNPRHR